MTTLKRCLLKTCSATLLAAPGISALAVGFRLPNQDPEGIARGNAFAATADNPSAIYYNPAGITQLAGDTISAGVYFVSAGINYTSPTGAKASPSSDFQPVPQIYYVHEVKDSPFTVGLGVYSPYGLSVDWGRNTSFNTLAENGKVAFVCLNPVIAWKICPKLSLAIGPTINYSTATFEQAFPAFSPDGTFRFKGDGMGYGFNAGLRWQPIEQLAFGVNYRYETEVDYDGNSQFQPLARTETHGPLVYPQYVVGGVSYRPTPDWNFEVNIDWTDWERVNDIVFNGTALGNVALPLNLKSSLMYEFGVTRQFGNGYFGSVGYFYSENSSPNAYFNPILPDANLQLGSIGFGHRGKRWDWAAAYHFGYNGERIVSGTTPSAFGQTADGRYTTLNHAFNISVAFKF